MHTMSGPISIGTRETFRYQLGDIRYLRVIAANHCDSDAFSQWVAIGHGEIIEAIREILN